MMRLTKLMKFEATFVVARLSHETAKANVYLHPDFAKRSGIREGDIVRISRAGKELRFRVKLLETAPEDGGVIPNSIFANYLTDFANFKRFKAEVELAEGEESTEEEVVSIIMQRKQR